MIRTGWLLLALTLGPIAAQAQTDSVSVYVERQQWTEAIRYLNVSLSTDPVNPELRFRLGQVLAWSGDFTGSVTLLRDLLADVPKYGEATILLARVHSWMGDYDLAEALYASVAKTDPSYPDALAGLAQLAFYRGDLNTAYVASGHVLRSYPSNETARTVRESIRKGMRPDSETRIMNPWDSDGNTTWMVTETAGFSLRPGLSGFVRVRAVDNGSTVFGWTGGARWNRFSASLGLNAYRQAERLNLDASVSARFSDLLLFANRYGLYDTPVLIRRAVTVNELGAAHLVRRGPLALASTSTLAAYSTGNQRVSASVDLGRAIALGDLTLTPGAATSMSAFLKNDPTGGFFAPKWWSVSTAKLQTVYAPASSPFFLSVHAQSGVQIIAPYDAERIGPDLSYAIDASAGYAPSQDLQIEAGYLYSTLVNATTQAGGSYWAQRLSLRIYLRF
jgi:tetratricopeptide (TPR) repeat protein